MPSTKEQQKNAFREEDDKRPAPIKGSPDQIPSLARSFGIGNTQVF